MGLLDVFNTDEGRLGLGLLAAAGPRADGAGFGQRLSEGLGSVDAWKKAALERKLLEAHAAQYASDAEAKKQAVEAAKMKSDLLRGLFGETSPGAFTTYGGAGPVMPAQQQGGIGGMDINTVSKLKALGGVDLMDQFKWANDPLKLDQGATYRDRITGKETYMPKIGEGVTMGPGGASEVPGYGTAMGGIEGAKANATERAKAKYDPTQYTFKGEDHPTPGSRLEIADFLNSQGPIRPAQQPAQPAQQRPITNMSGATLSPEVLALIQRTQDPNGPAPTVNIGQRGQTIGLAQPVSSGRVQLQSEAEKAAQLGAVKNVTEAGDKINAAWLKTSYEPVVENSTAAQKLIESTQVARDTMRKMGGTGWGTETKAAAANILSGLGIAPENAKMYATQSQVFQKTAMDRLWTTLNAAKGPQTEGDAARAAKTYAALGNTTEANEFILDMSQAQAERDKARAKFYQNALPIAKEKGDLSEVERIWQQKMPSIFEMPIMKKWGAK